MHITNLLTLHRRLKNEGHSGPGEATTASTLEYMLATRIVTKERDWEIQMLLGYICCARRTGDGGETILQTSHFQDWAVDNRSAREKKDQGRCQRNGWRIKRMANGCVENRWRWACVRRICDHHQKTERMVDEGGEKAIYNISS